VGDEYQATLQSQGIFWGGGKIGMPEELPSADIVATGLKASRRSEATPIPMFRNPE